MVEARGCPRRMTDCYSHRSLTVGRFTQAPEACSARRHYAAATRPTVRIVSPSSRLQTSPSLSYTITRFSDEKHGTPASANRSHSLIDSALERML
eukprot:scaffold312264_cov27-Tisochrysis_lutea.AAC.3